jgi:Rieske Fe-S protein
MSEQAGPTRRELLRGAGATGAVAALAVTTAGCGFVGAGKQDVSPDQPVTLGPASAVPVGGGVVYSAERVVVTQPAAGSFHAFSAVCTHQGCLVDAVSDGAIHCPCHGSAFSISDGAVLKGPADVPLPTAKLTLTGNDLILGG